MTLLQYSQTSILRITHSTPEPSTPSPLKISSDLRELHKWPMLHLLHTSYATDFGRGNNINN